MKVKELKASIDIKEVVSRYIDLRKIGDDRYIGLCPFHLESHPSFTIYADTQSFYCFGCGKGGDVINFIMEIEKVDFKEAVKFLEKFM